MKFLRGRYSFLIILTFGLLVLLMSFQNCGSPRTTINSPEDGIVHKIEVDKNLGALSIFDSELQSEQSRDLIQNLPANKPLVVLIRNGQLYPGVQLIINNRSYLVSDYLKLVKMFLPENPSVPIFYTPESVDDLIEDSTLEKLHEIRIDFGPHADSQKYCDAIVNLGLNPLEADLIVQIADASSMMNGSSVSVLKSFWSLPLKIFSPTTCGLP